MCAAMTRCINLKPCQTTCKLCFKSYNCKSNQVGENLSLKSAGKNIIERTCIHNDEEKC